VKQFLEQIDFRLKYEQNMSDATFNQTEHRFNRLINHEVEIMSDLHAKLAHIRARTANVSYTRETAEADLGSMDARIKTRSDKIGKIIDKISLGDFERKEQQGRYESRVNKTQTMLEAVNWMIDQLGSPTGKDSLKNALNQAYKDAPTASESGASTNATTSTSLVEAFESLHQAGESSGDTPTEIDDLDYLRELLGEMYANLHEYLRLLQVEEGNREMVWANAKFEYQNRSDSLQAEITEIESHRIPDRDAIVASKAELENLARTKQYVKAHLAKVKAKMDRFETALDRITVDYRNQRDMRAAQLEKVSQLMAVVSAHLGTTVNKPVQSSFQPVLK